MSDALSFGDSADGVRFRFWMLPDDGSAKLEIECVSSEHGTNNVRTDYDLTLEEATRLADWLATAIRSLTEKP